MDWSIVGALSTFGLLVVAFLQIHAVREEARKARTIAVCDRYDTDPVLHEAKRTLREAKRTLRETKLDFENPRDLQLQLYAKSLLNYLDSIAIGIKQGLYIENLARDHLEQIVADHCELYFDEQIAKNLDLQIAHFGHLKGLRDDWARKETYYKGTAWRRLWS